MRATGLVIFDPSVKEKWLNHHLVVTPNQGFGHEFDDYYPRHNYTTYADHKPQMLCVCKKTKDIVVVQVGFNENKLWQFDDYS